MVEAMERSRNTNLKAVITTNLEKIDSVYCELVEMLHITEQTAHLMINAVCKLIIYKGQGNLITYEIEELHSKLYEEPRAFCLTATMTAITD